VAAARVKLHKPGPFARGQQLADVRPRHAEPVADIAVGQGDVRAAAAGHGRMEKGCNHRGASGAVEEQQSVRHRREHLRASRGKAHVFERARGIGPAETLRATDLEGLIKDYGDFKGDKPEPVTIILFPYQGYGQGITSARERVMEDNAKLWFDYRKILDLADLALNAPETFYPFLANGKTGWDKRTISGIRAKIVAQQNAVASKISECTPQAKDCADLRDQLAAGESPDDYRDRLPKFLSWPDDCVSIRVSVPTAPDGDYQLFYQHHQGHRYTAYCKNMAGAPKTYFKLPFSDRDRNFAEIAEGGDYKGTTVRTVWSAIAIDTKSMQVRIADAEIATSTGNINGRQHATYGHAEQCWDDGRQDSRGRANIDLRGTGFAIDLKRSWLGSAGYWDRGVQAAPADHVAVSEAGQVADFTSHFGGCAGAKADPLYLVALSSR
jgi:hypothetical protein